MCRNARTNLKIKSLSSISNRNQNRSVNISWERNCATWQKFFHYQYIDCLIYHFSRLTVTKTFHSEYEEKKKILNIRMQWRARTWNIRPYIHRVFCTRINHWLFSNVTCSIMAEFINLFINLYLIMYVHCKKNKLIIIVNLTFKIRPSWYL